MASTLFSSRLHPGFTGKSTTTKNSGLTLFSTRPNPGFTAKSLKKNPRQCVISSRDACLMNGVAPTNKGLFEVSMQAGKHGIGGDMGEEGFQFYNHEKKILNIEEEKLSTYIAGMISMERRGEDYSDLPPVVPYPMVFWDFDEYSKIVYNHLKAELARYSLPTERITIKNQIETIGTTPALLFISSATILPGWEYPSLPQYVRNKIIICYDPLMKDLQWAHYLSERTEESFVRIENGSLEDFISSVLLRPRTFFRVEKDKTLVLPIPVFTKNMW